MKLKDIKLVEQKYTSFKEIGEAYTGGDLLVRDRKFTSLEGCPKHITGTFDVTGNVFSSLKYAPTEIDGNFICTNNGGFIDFANMPKIKAKMVKLSGKNRENMRQWKNFSTLLRHLTCESLDFSIYSMKAIPDKLNLTNFLIKIREGMDRKNKGEDIDEICSDISFWCSMNDIPFEMFGD